MNWIWAHPAIGNDLPKRPAVPNGAEMTVFVSGQLTKFVAVFEN
jgi:hypothetical protein